MSQSQRIETSGCGLSRSRKLNLIIAGVSWTLGSIVLAFWIRDWAAQGLPSIENTMTAAFAVIGTALGGLLALSGDGDVAFFTGVDEGQRETIHRAGASALSVAFWGMFGLWIAYQIQPIWRADAWLHLGGLLLLSIIFYSGGYLWRRWR